MPVIFSSILDGCVSPVDIRIDDPAVVRRIAGKVLRQIRRVWYAGASRILTATIKLVKCDVKTFEMSHQSDLMVLFPQKNVILPAMLCGDPEQHPFRSLLQPFNVRAAYVFALSNCNIIGESPVCIDANRTVVPDVFPGRTISDSALSQAKRSLWLRERSLPLVCSLLDPFAHNYFHWFLDVLPRLRELEAYEAASGQRAVLLVPGWMTPWQKRSLELLGAGGETTPHRVQFGLFRLCAETLVVPSSSRFHGDDNAPFAAMDPSVCQWLQKSFCGRQKPDKADRNHRLFISRSKASSRRIVNEENVVQAVQRFGFEVHSLEDLSFERQVDLFSSASHVIAAHGSGLTNLLFANQCNVYELFASRHGVRSDYFQICMALGHSYHYMICKSESNADDFCVNIAALEEMLVN